MSWSAWSIVGHWSTNKYVARELPKVLQDCCMCSPFSHVPQTFTNCLNYENSRSLFPSLPELSLLVTHSETSEWMSFVTTYIFIALAHGSAVSWWTSKRSIFKSGEWCCCVHPRGSDDLTQRALHAFYHSCVSLAPSARMFRQVQIGELLHVHFISMYSTL